MRQSALARKNHNLGEASSSLRARKLLNRRCASVSEFIEQTLNFNRRFSVVGIKNQRYSRFVPGSVVPHFPTSDQAKHASDKQRHTEPGGGVSGTDCHSYRRDYPDSSGCGRTMYSASPADEDTGSEKANPG